MALNALPFMQRVPLSRAWTGKTPSWVLCWGFGGWR